MIIKILLVTMIQNTLGLSILKYPTCLMTQSNSTYSSTLVPLFMTMVGACTQEDWWEATGTGIMLGTNPLLLLFMLLLLGDEVTNDPCFWEGGEFSFPVLLEAVEDIEVVVAGEKTCGGGNSLLCLIRHWSSSTWNDLISITSQVLKYNAQWSESF